MITKLVVKNFQKHRNLTLRLSKTVTTIVGPNDAGKSALVRALQWVALNKTPRKTPGEKKDSFIHKGEKRATVTLEVDGHTVTRTKGKTKNTYHVDGRKLAAFGSKVPDEVASVLNIGELNFQEQHKLALWFSETPGEVSRQLNKIVDLEIIDSTLKKLGDQTRHARAAERVIQERLKKAATERRALRPTKEADRDLKKLERLQESLSALSEKVTTLAQLVALAKDATTHIDRITPALMIGGVLFERGLSLKRITAERKEIESLLARARAQTLAARVKVTIPPTLEALCKKLKRVSFERATLQELVEDAQKEVWNVEHNELQLLLHKKELKKEFKACPLCEQTLPSNAARKR